MQMMRKRTNCYIYTRVSTSMQVDGYSLDAQREKLRGYAAYQEMTVVGEYSDEGFSGKNIQGRMEFRRMLEDIQTQKDSVDYVLVFKLSRFGRNAADVLNSLQLMHARRDQLRRRRRRARRVAHQEGRSRRHP